MTHQKETLRDQARKHLIREDVYSETPEDAAALFFDVVDLQANMIVAGFWPKGREFDVTPLLEGVLERGGQCALPVCEKDSRVLKFVSWSEETKLVKGEYGIMVPEGYQDAEAVMPDIVLVPFLSFDRYGTRLGQGGGYYDATLEHLRAQKDILAIGMGYAAQAVLFKLPMEEHDQKLDMVITPQAIHDFRK